MNDRPNFPLAKATKVISASIGEQNAIEEFCDDPEQGMSIIILPPSEDINGIICKYFIDYDYYYIKNNNCLAGFDLERMMEDFETCAEAARKSSPQHSDAITKIWIHLEKRGNIIKEEVKKLIESRNKEQK